MRTWRDPSASTRRAARCARSCSRRCTAAPSTCCAPSRRAGAREEREAFRSPSVDIDLEREVMQLTEAETVRAALADALRRRARGDRARVLRRAYLPRGRGAAGTARRHGEEPDPSRAAAAAGRVDRSGGERMSDPMSDAGRQRARLAARRVRARRARRRRPRARRGVPRARTRPRAPRSTRCARPRRRSRSLPPIADRRAARAVGPHRAGDRERSERDAADAAAATAPRRRARARAARVAAGPRGSVSSRSPRPRSRSWCSARRSRRCTAGSTTQRSARPRWPRPSNDAAKTPGAHEVGLKSDSGADARARSCCSPTARATCKSDDLAPLPHDKTYQLWAVTGSEKTPTVVSAGVLGPTRSARVPRERPGARVRGHGRERGRRRGVAATAGRGREP